jgi:hypothetical protein
MPCALTGNRATDAVVADLDQQLTSLAPDADRGRVGAAVLGDIGQQLGDAEVGGRLDRGRRPLRHLQPAGDRDRAAGGQHRDGTLQAQVGQNRRVDAAGQVAQLHLSCRQSNVATSP